MTTDTIIGGYAGLLKALHDRIKDDDALVMEFGEQIKEYADTRGAIELIRLLVEFAEKRTAMAERHAEILERLANVTLKSPSTIGDPRR